MKPVSVLLPALLLFLVSCSGSGPSIDEMKWKVVLRDDGETRYEQLMVFARFSDPDSSEDPALAVVAVDGTDLIWRFERPSWSEDPSGGGWWGLPPMASPTGYRLPDGIYRLRLEDLAGRSAELEFRPDPSRPLRDEIVWPAAAVADGRLNLEPSNPGARILIRNSEGALVESLPAADGTAVEMMEGGSWELHIPAGVGEYDVLMGPFRSEGFEPQ